MVFLNFLGSLSLNDDTKLAVNLDIFIFGCDCERPTKKALV